MQKVCAICGKEFEAHNSAQRYCSNQCRAIAEKEHERKRRQRGQPRSCVICGKPVLPNGNAKTCSPECGKQLRRETLRYKRKTAEERKMHQCLICGVSFAPVGGRETTCSAECRAALKRQREREKYWRSRGGMPQRARQSKPVSGMTIADIVHEAAKLGMTYGKYIAQMEGRDTL